MKNKILLVGILVIAIALTLSVSFYKQIQQETEKVRLLEEKAKLIAAEGKIIETRIEEAKAKKLKLQDELDTYNERVQLLEADVQGAQQEKNKLFNELSEREQVILRLGDRLDSITQQEANLNTELAKAKADYQAATLAIEAARKEKAQMEERIASSISTRGGVELKKIVVKVTPPAEGRVLDANLEYNFVIVDLGLKNNVKSGDIFGIYRQGQLVAKAVAEYIYEDMSSIIVLEEWLDVPILKGDTVKLLTS